MPHRENPRDRFALEDELRSHAPEPEFEWARSLERTLGGPAPRPARQSSGRLRLALAGGLTLALTVGLGVTGGFSYAASSLAGAAKIVHRATKPQTAIVVRGLSAGSDQYRPGYGFGDPNHNHTGPPGLTRSGGGGKPGSLAPPLQAAATRDGFGATVATTIAFDEQAHLYISVVDGRGKPLLLTQRSRRGGSKVGNAIRGPQTKFIQYAVLVPRAIPISLRIPRNLLRGGAVYRLRIVAIDPDGNRSQLLVPFRA